MPCGHMLRAARSAHGAERQPSPDAHVPDAGATAGEDSGCRDGKVSLAV